MPLLSLCNMLCIVVVEPRMRFDFADCSAEDVYYSCGLRFIHEPVQNAQTPACRLYANSGDDNSIVVYFSRLSGVSHDRFFTHCFGHAWDLFFACPFICSCTGIFHHQRPFQTRLRTHSKHCNVWATTIKLLGMAQPTVYQQ